MTVKVSALNKTYLQGNKRVHAVRDLFMQVEKGEFCSIVGASGCGKSTLLQLLAGNLAPDSGRLEIDGVEVTSASEEKRAEMRRQKLLLKADIGRDVLTVAVNGEPVKTCLWRPYEADLTPYLHEGENEITLGVVNTLMNLLESTHNPSGLFRAEIVPFDRYSVQF